METYLDGLDADQRRAVQHKAGPLLVVAGAGSGKTRAIVARIVRLVRDGVPPRRIVGITFTNRAAEEMRDRVARQFPDGADLPWLGTFHAFGAILLRRFGSRIGLPPGFVIYDARDQQDVVRQAVRDNNLDEKKFPPAMFAGLIERAKRDGVTVAAAAAAAGYYFADKAAAVGAAYDAALSSAGAVDFSDLIRQPVRLFREVPEALSAVRAEVRHLLVDEFQDVDRGQAELSRLLAEGADSFCAVGDEDQSIYGWRGGSAGPMLSFERDHRGATVLHLGTNYRTKSAILCAAGEVIGKNRLRREKRIVPAREGGEPPAVLVHADGEAEADAVAAAVAAEIRRAVSPAEIAVFYRVNAQSRAIEDALRRRDIPYVLRGALSFYDRASVRDGMAYLKWFLNPDDPVSLKRLLRAPRRGVGDVALSRARETANLSGVPLSDALGKIPGMSPLFSLRGRWLSALPTAGPGEALRALLDGSGYLAWLEERAREAGEGQEARRDDLENVRELLGLAGAFKGEGEEAVRDFLEKVSLSPRDEGGEADNAVRLMTFHTAKGLEFDVVFLVGLEEGLLPHSRSADSGSGLEEERRLFYVGLTRAREKAFLSFARRRMLFGAHRDAIPSRFLYEIPPALVRWEEAGSPQGGAPRRTTVAGSPVCRVTTAAGPQRKSRRVRHPFFGEGKVEAEEGEGAERKIIARFPGYGVKKILVRAVNMELLD